uniref:Uncharacterized protein n=1 Tax=Picea glauca TaxID=3330 RepID=A0A124GP92_PICGL|nr:hypothetical protein ABT39_MTgene1063 [Picea glauca]
MPIIVINIQRKARRVSKPREIYLPMVLPAPRGLMVTCVQSQVKSAIIHSLLL